MAITSVGYDGTVNDTAFAPLAQHIGALFPVVGGRTDFAVAVNGAATLTCTVQPGIAAAPGVMDTSSGVESVVFDAVVTTGHTRWDAVVLRRNWSSGTTTLVVVKGTSAAGAVMVNPSGVDLVLDSGQDQVLALVQLTYGSTVPTAVVDRRLQATKVFTAPDVSALPTASNALYGVEAVAGGVRYRCQLVAGSPSWLRQGQPVVTTSGFSASASGWTTTGQSSRYTVDGSEIQYDLEIRRTGTAIQFDSNGNLTDTTVLTLSGVKPDAVIPVLFTARGGSTATANTGLSAFGHVETNGEVVLNSGLPSQWIATQATPGVWSLRVTIKFTKGS